MRKNYGGPAFPGYFCDEDGEDLYHHGISLRDYFAGQALVGICSKIGCNISESVAEAYLYADAMLKERNK